MDNSKKIKNFLFDLLFPKFCVGCKREGDFLCQDCHSLLDICEYNYCLCELRPQIIPPGQTRGKCNKCQEKILAGLYFATPYKDNRLAQKLIHQFKYQPFLKELAPVLAQIIGQHLVQSGRNSEEVWANSVLVAVPGHISKTRERGYNPPEELAKELSKITNVPVVLDNLVKTKKTEQQMKLSKKKREENLKGVFEIKNPAIWRDKKVFLVDDVYTTGCTMTECAKVLRKAGAKQVWGLALARENLD